MVVLAVAFLVSAVVLDTLLVAFELFAVLAVEDEHVEGPVLVVRGL